MKQGNFATGTVYLLENSSYALPITRGPSFIALLKRLSLYCYPATAISPQLLFCNFFYSFRNFRSNMVLPCANWGGMTVGRILSLACEIATVMLNCGYEFQYGYCHVAFAVFHQFLNSTDTISQNQTPVINPRDLKKKSIVLTFCLLFVPQS